MSDKSELDNRYFIDDHVYNCPFCNRRHVSYTVFGKYWFNWTDTKVCWIYLTRCASCLKVGMHLSYHDLKILPEFGVDGKRYQKFSGEHTTDLDAQFFYSVPTSFFVLDPRIPKMLRELITEAEGCLKSNFLTGASACARKAIYELASLRKASGENYEDRIKSLKKLNPDVDPDFFDTLLTIQQVTSKKVHEESYDGWESKHLRLILSTLAEILNEIYVVPALRADKRKSILDLKSEVLGQKDS